MIKLFLLALLSLYSSSHSKDVSHNSGIVLKNYSIKSSKPGLDKLFFDDVNITIQNKSNKTIKPYYLYLLSYNDTTIYLTSSIATISIKPNKDTTISFSCTKCDPINIKIGTDTIPLVLNLLSDKINNNRQLYLSESIKHPIPMLYNNDTVIIQNQESKNIQFVFDSWISSDLCVLGKFNDGNFYTFHSRPDMVFVILFYKLINNNNRETNAPYINEAEIGTENQRIYSQWKNSGLLSKEYNPVVSTKEEINLLTFKYNDKADFLPGDILNDYLVFEIPKKSNPININLKFISENILLKLRH